MSGPMWTPVGTVDDIPLQGARVVRVGAVDIAVFRTEAGHIHAIEDRCPHRNGPLSPGIVHGGQVTCPLHNLVIDLESGRPEDPEEGCVQVFPVEIADGEIRLDLSALHPASEGKEESGRGRNRAAA